MPKSNQNYSDYFTFNNVCTLLYCLVYFIAKVAEALEKEQDPATAYAYFDAPEAATELEGSIQDFTSYRAVAPSAPEFEAMPKPSAPPLVSFDPIGGMPLEG